MLFFLTIILMRNRIYQHNERRDSSSKSNFFVFFAVVERF